MPGGGNIPVTNANRVEFIHHVSNYRLNTQLRVATEAFKRGFSHLIDPTWVTMFNGEELQMLISGGADLGLDLDDLKQNITYASGYGEDHAVIQIFWQVSGLCPFHPETSQEGQAFAQPGLLQACCCPSFSEIP